MLDGMLIDEWSFRFVVYYTTEFAWLAMYTYAIVRHWNPVIALVFTVTQNLSIFTGQGESPHCALYSILNGVEVRVRVVIIII